MKHNIYILLHACSTTMRLLHSWAVRRNLCNSRVQGRAKVSTKKTFFERLYLVPGLRSFEPCDNCQCAPTPPPLKRQLFLDLGAWFCLNSCVSTIYQVIWPSPGTARSVEDEGISGSVWDTRNSSVWDNQLIKPRPR